MSFAIYEWCEFDHFYKEYKPLSHGGKILKDKKIVYTNIDDLKKQYFYNDICLDFYKKTSERSLSKIKYHLSRIPEIKSFSIKNSSDIFIFKKAIYNYISIYNMLDKTIIEKFKLKVNVKNLKDFLDLGGKDTESFHLSEDFSEELSKIRKEIIKIQKKLKNEKIELLDNIKENTGFDFRFNEFLIIKIDETKNKNSELLFFEPYDSHNYIIRPIYTDKYLDIYKKMEDLIAVEKDIEKKIIKKIQDKILKYKEDIVDFINKINFFDSVLARVPLIIKYDLNRPDVSGKDIKIKNGVFLPLKYSEGIVIEKYTPLNIDLEKNVNILRGSNMGGKTVVLKTFCFLQLMAQMGFYVSADKFCSKVFDGIYYTGEFINKKIDGLSSFGMEIFIFNKMFENIKKDNESLIFIDEFARTTNSTEATAMLSSIIKNMIEKEDVICILSTHFMQLPLFEKVGYLKMKGLNHGKFYEYSRRNIDKLEDKIKLINDFMDYKVIKDSSDSEVYDALNIAELLGLDKKIIQDAGKYVGRKYETK